MTACLGERLHLSRCLLNGPDRELPRRDQAAPEILEAGRRGARPAFHNLYAPAWANAGIIASPAYCAGGLTLRRDRGSLAVFTIMFIPGWTAQALRSA
jgi:hypothetical protein